MPLKYAERINAGRSAMARAAAATGLDESMPDEFSWSSEAACYSNITGRPSRPIELTYSRSIGMPCNAGE
jgi:hypothetical protein